MLFDVDNPLNNGASALPSFGLSGGLPEVVSNFTGGPGKYPSGQTPTSWNCSGCRYESSGGSPEVNVYANTPATF